MSAPRKGDVIRENMRVTTRQVMQLVAQRTITTFYAFCSSARTRSTPSDQPQTEVGKCGGHRRPRSSRPHRRRRHPRSTTRRRNLPSRKHNDLSRWGDTAHPASPLIRHCDELVCGAGLFCATLSGPFERPPARDRRTRTVTPRCRHLVRSGKGETNPGNHLRSCRLRPRRLRLRGRCSARHARAP